MQTEIQTKWFKEQLALRDLSLRGLARKLELDPATVSYMLRGKRRMTPADCANIARIFLLPVTEVMRNAGVDVSDNVRGVLLTGTIDSESEVHDLQSKVEHNAPPDVPTESYILQVRAPSSPFDGWSLFCAKSQNLINGLNRFCIVHLRDGTRVLGILKAGYDEALFNVVATFPKPFTLENVAVVQADPVMWVRPR